MEFYDDNEDTPRKPNELMVEVKSKNIKGKINIILDITFV